MILLFSYGIWPCNLHTHTHVYCGSKQKKIFFQWQLFHKEHQKRRHQCRAQDKRGKRKYDTSKITKHLSRNTSWLKKISEMSEKEHKIMTLRKLTEMKKNTYNAEKWGRQCMIQMRNSTEWSKWTRHSLTMSVAAIDPSSGLYSLWNICLEKKLTADY